MAATHLAEMLGDADAVVLACNQTADNRGMVNDGFLADMKRGATLVNVARGGLLDKDALLRALESGHLGYLASDVAWTEPAGFGPFMESFVFDRSFVSFVTVCS